MVKNRFLGSDTKLGEKQYIKFHLSVDYTLLLE